MRRGKGTIGRFLDRCFPRSSAAAEETWGTRRRLGRTAEARSAYEKALALTQQEPERQFLQERIRQMK
jgi:predicted RNA polymerase sigma factor